MIYLSFICLQQHVSMSLFANVQCSFPFWAVTQQHDATVFPVKEQTSVNGLAEVVSKAATSVVKMRDFIVPPMLSGKDYHKPAEERSAGCWFAFSPRIG